VSTLTSPLRIALPPNDLGDRTRAVLGTIPGLATPDDRDDAHAGQSADVVVVTGHDTEWPRAAAEAIAEGVAAVVVSDPTPVSVAALKRLLADAEDRGTAVAVDTAFATDPAWVAARDTVAQSALAAKVIDSVVTVPSEANTLAAALLAQLAVVRPLLGSAVELATVASSPDHYVLAGVSGKTAVTLVGVRSGGADEAGLTVDVVGVDQHWQVVFAEAGPARPTEIVLRDSTGQHGDRPHYESGRRASWRAMHAALTSEGRPAYTLAGLQADLALVGSVTGFDL
jgi:hypothetical protein